LQEIQISYLLNKTATANHSIDVGQFKIPIGYEGDQVSSGNLQTVERALFFTQRDPSGADQGYGDVRDTGAQLRGTIGPVDYRLGVFNGLGDRQNTTASSDPKAVVARLAYRPAFVQGLTVGVSGGRGNTALGAGNRRFENELLNAFAAYKRDKITFQAEYLQGETQLRGGAANSDVRGYYGSLGYLFTPKLEGVFRYDSFDSARNVANAEVRDITLGLNYYIKGSNAKIQANVVNRSGAPGSPVADLRPDRTELRTNFQVAF
jgi:phosphate-selective porin